MRVDADILTERSRLKRKLTFWRVSGLLLLTAVIFGGLVSSGDGAGLASKDHIARVKISGIITDNDAQHKMLKKIAKSKRVKALVLRINSPGGTTTGGEALYERLKDINKDKPVVAVFGTVAASAAYMIAMSSDHIVARGNTITGSVGVIFQYPEVSALLDKVGVKVKEIKSGTLKANPSPFQPTDAAGLKVAREMVTDTFEWFLELVAKRRKIKPEDVPGLRQGRIFTGRQALKLKLIDEIGGEEQAIAWLEKNKGIQSKLPIKNWKIKSKNKLSLLTGLAYLSRRVGLSEGGGLSGLEHIDAVRQRVQFSGLLSLWSLGVGN